MKSVRRHSRAAGSSHPTTAAAAGGLPRLLLAVLALCIIWLILLPIAARQPHMQARSQLYDSYGIDVGAMVYTEIDAADDALSAWESIRRAHPKTLWLPR